MRMPPSVRPHQPVAETHARPVSTLGRSPTSYSIPDPLLAFPGDEAWNHLAPASRTRLPDHHRRHQTSPAVTDGNARSSNIQLQQFSRRACFRIWCVTLVRGEFGADQAIALNLRNGVAGQCRAAACTPSPR
jgi:hypothetical protein